MSAGGVGLLLARRFEPGTRLDIELTGESGRRSRPVGTTVVRVQKDKAGHWVHGCRFAAPPADADLTFLMAFA